MLSRTILVIFYSWKIYRNDVRWAVPNRWGLLRPGSWNCWLNIEYEILNLDQHIYILSLNSDVKFGVFLRDKKLQKA